MKIMTHREYRTLYEYYCKDSPKIKDANSSESVSSEDDLKRTKAIWFGRLRIKEPVK